jgi:hypothetical protein
LAQIREQEYMIAATTRRGGYRRGHRLIAGVTRRLRRRNHSTELADPGDGEFVALFGTAGP